jgi:hypothetical protein
VSDDRQLALRTDSSLCHGWAGLVQAAWRASTDAADPDLFALPLLRRRMDEHLHRRGMPRQDGLLEGAAGVQLIRHAIAAGVAPSSDWDACLLLRG